MADKLLKSLDFGTGDKYYPSTKWENVEGKPTIPTKTSELENDSNFLTQHQSLSAYSTTAQNDEKYQPKGNYATQTSVDSLSEEIGDINETLVSIDLTKYVTKQQGVANAGKILAVGTNGLLTLVDMPSGGGDVVGTLDGNNNILLSGNLADGTYTVKFENEDGTYSDIGNLVVSNGGTEEPELPYTNLANPSSDEWMDGYRISSSGVVEPTSGVTLMNTVPCVKGDRIRVKGVTTVVCSMYKNGVFYKRASITSTSDQYTSPVVNGDYCEFGIAYTDITSIRMYGTLSGNAEDVIITINEEIV